MRPIRNLNRLREFLYVSEYDRKPVTRPSHPDFLFNGLWMVLRKSCVVYVEQQFNLLDHSGYVRNYFACLLSPFEMHKMIFNIRTVQETVFVSKDHKQEIEVTELSSDFMSSL